MPIIVELLARTVTFGPERADAEGVVHRFGILDHDANRRAAARRGGDDAVLSIAADHAVGNRHVDAACAVATVRRDPERIAVDGDALKIDPVRCRPIAV